MWFYKMGEQEQDGKAMCSFMLDIVTWKVSGEKIYSGEISVDGMIDEFMDSHLNDQLKTRFLTHWSLAKECGRENYMDYLSRDTIDSVLSAKYLVPYEDIYGSADMELFYFEYGGNTYEIVDHYCMRPKCLCSEIKLQVLKMDDTKEVQQTLFAVAFDPATCRYDVVEIGCTYEEMTGVVDHAVRNNSAMLKTLQRRYAEMKTAAREIGKKYGQKAGPRVNPVKTGRNDPCPCGSGKKYKNCCLR